MKTYQHILFWTIGTALLVLFFGRSYDATMEALFFVSLLLPVIMGTCYFFNYYLVPKYLLTKRKLQFAIYTIYMFIISVYLEMLVITLAFIYLANYNYANMSPLMSDVSILATTMYLLVLLFSFMLLVKRTLNDEKNITQLEQEKEKQQVGYLDVRSNRKNVKIKFDDITSIESLSDYVKIHYHENQQVITKEKISRLAEKLPHNFIRLHRSFIVNKHEVSSFNKEVAVVHGKEFPISRTYKAEAMARLNA